MPFERPTPQKAEAQGIALRYASVALPVFVKDGAWHIALMKRTEYPGVHSGQISIPGGEVEAHDADRLATALREFEEEMGVDLSQAPIVQGLSERFIPPSRFVVTPFVALLEGEPEWEVDPAEVARVLTLPVSALLDDRSMQSVPIEIKRGVRVELPAYQWDGEVIWGATAIMLTEFAMAWSHAMEEG
jgi:8-oxo-dGTP pyrophosphatase MutT (NUDIX family)